MIAIAGWTLALVILGSLLTAYLIFYISVIVWARISYRRFQKNPNMSCDIDKFVGPNNPPKCVKVMLIHKMQVGFFRKPSYKPIPFEVLESSHVKGIFTVRRQGTTDASKTKILNMNDFFNNHSKPPIVVASIRMGFGHHRLAYSIASWALQTGRNVIAHDCLSIDSEEAGLIRSADATYSKFSRWASEYGGWFENWWGRVTLGGDANSLRVTTLAASHLQPLLLSYPKSTPIIATHQVPAMIAAAAGFHNVINLVVDNYPQWFLTSPNCLNGCQGPVNYQSFMKMGIPPENMKLMGAWCPRDLVEHIDEDCTRRLQRAKNRDPIRFLIPIGGAGAQKTYILHMVKWLSKHVREGTVQLLLNAGDHKHMKEAFEKVLKETKMDYDVVSDAEGVRKFQKKLLTGAEPSKPITLFAFDDYFPAVESTDILCRVCDIMMTKPSELAFYCTPKLHIRRVGDHEMGGCFRASEMGDGTVECREPKDAIEFIELMLKSPDLLTSFNEAIINNNKIGLYDGCKRVVDQALSNESIGVNYNIGKYHTNGFGTNPIKKFE